MISGAFSRKKPLSLCVDSAWTLTPSRRFSFVWEPQCKAALAHRNSCTAVTALKALLPHIPADVGPRPDKAGLQLSASPEAASQERDSHHRLLLGQLTMGQREEASAAYQLNTAVARTSIFSPGNLTPFFNIHFIQTTSEVPWNPTQIQLTYSSIKD